MEDKNDILQAIPHENIPQLLQVLKQDFPGSIVVYYFLETQLRWSQNIPEMQLKVLCPRGEWQHGMVVVLVSGLALEKKQYGVLYARVGDESRLSDVLHTTRVIPWRHLMHFGGILERHIEIVCRAALAAGVTPPPLDKQPPMSYLFVYPKPTPDQKPSEIPGIRISRLQPSDLEDIWRLRPLFPNYYKPVISACLAHNICLGAWAKTPQGGEELVSIVTQSEYGGLGMGQTHESYYRRGLSQYLGYYMLLAIIESGIEPFSWSSITNNKTKNFMIKFGVPIVDKCMRLTISPQIELKNNL